MTDEGVDVKGEVRTFWVVADAKISTAERVAANQSLSEYITGLLTNYYENGGKITMENVRTLAIQIPEELFQKLKAHLDAESRRRGKKVSQKEFLLELIRQALEGTEE